MGTFSQEITLRGPGGESVTLDGIVDTGAMFSVVPASTLRRLGVQALRRVPVRFASGDLQRWQMGEVEAELLATTSPILVFFGADDAPALIGAHTLEAFLLDVDVVEQRLVPKEALLMTTYA